MIKTLVSSAALLIVPLFCSADILPSNYVYRCTTSAANTSGIVRYPGMESGSGGRAPYVLAVYKARFNKRQYYKYRIAGRNARSAYVSIEFLPQINSSGFTYDERTLDYQRSDPTAYDLLKIIKNSDKTYTGSYYSNGCTWVGCRKFTMKKMTCTKKS